MNVRRCAGERVVLTSKTERALLKWILVNSHWYAIGLDGYETTTDVTPFVGRIYIVFSKDCSTVKLRTNSTTTCPDYSYVCISSVVTIVVDFNPKLCCFWS